MAVPNSDDLTPLVLSGIAKEKIYDDYNYSHTFTVPHNKISLKYLTTGETPPNGFYGSASSGFEATNQNQCTQSSYMGAEDNNAPYKMSEWWGYDHDVVVNTIYITAAHQKSIVVCSYTTATALYYTGSLADNTRLYTAVTRCFQLVDGSILDQRFKTAGKYGYATSNSTTATGWFEIDEHGDLTANPTGC